MSKRSLFWSTASGKLGDIVLRNVHGETVASKYQPQVANPRSYSQMYVRAQFATAVKFFRHASDNFFKFAFEDKKRNESDYNAFMRYNAKRGCIIDDLRTKTYPYPAWGLSWMLSNGSLPEAIIKVSADTDFPLSLKTPSISESTPATIGAMSDIIIKDYGLQAGDYITIVGIKSGYSSYEYHEDIPQPKWYIRQIRINPNDETEWGGDYDINIAKDAVAGYISFNFNQDGTTIKFGSASCFAIIFSRVLPDKTLVSPSNTLGNTLWNQITNNFTTNAAIDINLQTWGATPDAILRGAIANKR